MPSFDPVQDSFHGLLRFRNRIERVHMIHLLSDNKLSFPSGILKFLIVLKWWCRQNDIPYNDDMDNINAAYRWYYKYEDEGDNYSPIYILATH